MPRKLSRSEQAKRTRDEALGLRLMNEARASIARDKAAEEEARKIDSNLRMYSPRREWRTKYGAVFVEGIGFTRLAGDPE